MTTPTMASIGEAGPSSSPFAQLPSTPRILTSHQSTLATSLLDLRSSRPRTSVRLAHAFANRLRPEHVADLDLAQTLGGVEDGVPYGHSGCVNALHWTQGGTLLSGSDDTTVCVWEPAGGSTYNDDDGPNVDMRLTGVIHTGHRANIFSVKTPSSHPNRVFTAAGDRQVRVFDLNVQGRSSRLGMGAVRGPEWTTWDAPARSHTTNTAAGEACTQVFRCHKGRAKRLEAEIGGMSVLSVAEDGDVRQMDLRVPHTCPSCPIPLLHLPFTLYSLSIPTSAPHLLCVAGASPYAYLYDRRMIGREMSSEWGSVAAARFNPDGSPSEGMTRCVRRFGLESDRKGRNLNREDHVTAVKLSDWDGERLLVSYSSDGVYRFNIKDSPGESHDETRQGNEAGGGVASGSGAKKQTASLDIAKLKRRAVRYLFGSGSRLTAASLARKLDRALGGAVELDDEDRRWLAVAEAMVGLERAQMACDPFSRKRLVEPDDCRAVLRRLRQKTQGGADAGPDTDDEDEERPRPSTSQLQAREESMEAQKTAGAPRRRISQHDITTLVDMWKELEQAAGWENRREYRRVRQRIWSISERMLRGGMGGAEADVDEALERLGEGRIGEAVAEGAEDGDVEMGGVQHWLDRRAEEEREEEDDEADSDEDSLALEGHDEEDEDEEQDEEEEDTMHGSDEEEEDEDEEEYARRGMDLSAIERDARVVTPRRVYRGHVNVDTVKDVNFLGARDEYVTSGSDDGLFFVWSSHTGALLGVYKGDGSVTNVVQPHPALPVLAVSGIDDSPKLFAPRPQRRRTAAGGERVPAEREGEGRRWKANLWEEREAILQRNRNQRSGRSGLGSRAMLSFFAQQLLAGGLGGGGAGGGEGGTGGRQRIIVGPDGEPVDPQDCIVA